MGEIADSVLDGTLFGDCEGARMKLSTIYRNAAEVVDMELTSACYVLWREAGNASLVEAFRHQYQGRRSKYKRWWSFTPEGMNARVIALLLMAEIAKDEE